MSTDREDDDRFWPFGPETAAPDEAPTATPPVERERATVTLRPRPRRPDLSAARTTLRTTLRTAAPRLRPPLALPVPGVRAALSERARLLDAALLLLAVVVAVLVVLALR